jgi:hypothetical protein
MTIVTNAALMQLRRRHSGYSSLDQEQGEEGLTFSERSADLKPSPEEVCSILEARKRLVEGVQRLSQSFVLPGQNAFRQGRPGQNPQVQRFRHGNQFALDRPLNEAVLDLQPDPTNCVQPRSSARVFAWAIHHAGALAAFLVSVTCVVSAARNSSTPGASTILFAAESRFVNSSKQ